MRTELTRRLGVRWREPVNGIAEIDGVPEDVLATFSSRTDAIRRRVDDKLDRFTDHFERAPTPRERWRLEREAVIESRPSKAHCVDAESLHEGWLGALRGAGYEAEEIVAHAVVAGVQPVPSNAALAEVIDGREQIVQRALQALAERQSTWRPAELVRELAAAVPTNIRAHADDLVTWIDRLSEEVIAGRLVDLSQPVPEGVRRRVDGRPVSEAVTDRALTTPDILAEEERLLAWAEQRMSVGGTGSAEVLARAPQHLTRPQREAAAALAGTRGLVLVKGPAGTGKTVAARPGIDQLRSEGRAIFGVAPSATAAEVLATEADIAADTLDKLLIEHRLERPPDHRYDLPAGATVIVDEAAMVPTPRLAELADLAQRRSWRVVLIGDPLQFSAVGRSGMFGHLAETCGAIELDRVQRFVHDWERDASLRLRRGDTEVVSVYDEHGRLHGGTRTRMQAATVRAWWEATQHGESASMMAPTTEAVVALNEAAQQLRIHSGTLDPSGPACSAGAHRIHAGDLVTSRRNDRRLRTDRGLMVKNRDHWTVMDVHRDGGLSLSGNTGFVRLPAEYVAEHVELAYAETSHANQGRTVDRSLLFLDGPTDTRGIYVPMTRGRQANEVFVALEGDQSAADVVADALSRDWIDQPAVVRRAELQRSATPPAGDNQPPQPMDGAVVQLLLERAAELERGPARADFEVGHVTRQLRATESRRQQLVTSIEDDRSRLERAHRTVEQLDRPLRRRRHRVEVDTAHSHLRNLPSGIERKQAEIDDLAAKAGAHREELAIAKEAASRRGDLTEERLSIACQLSFDVKARANVVKDDLPPHLADRLGPRPPGGPSASLWDAAAGHIEQHRAAFAVEGTVLLGRRPRWNDTTYATSQRAAMDAVERLDRVLGRELAIEPPSMELGLSL